MSARAIWGAVLVLVTLAPQAPAQQSALDRYVGMDLESNLTLRQQDFAALEASARWSEARRAYLPTVQLDARYSRAEGGRTSVIRTGDLMNPVYGALNEILASQGQPAPFPMIDNQTIDFLRGREQDTRIRVTQVIWNPAINGNIRSQGYLVDSERAGLEATRRRVVRDIKSAYFQYVNATRAVAILDAAVDLVAENERANTSLWQTSLVTRDRVHRARAERLEVEQQRDRADAERAIAGSYLNYLLDRDPSASIEIDEVDLALPDLHASSWTRLASTTGQSLDLSFLDSLANAALEVRAELRQLGFAVEAAEAGISAVRGASLPSLVFALDAGIQGREYGVGSEDRFAVASLVLSWNLTSGGAERARVRVAQLQRDRLSARRDEAARQIRLEVENAARYALVALNGLTSARERVAEAQSAFRFVNRRRDEGLATELEFLDARASLTRAELSLNITETDALIRLADLEFASGTPVRSALSSTTEEN